MKFVVFKIEKTALKNLNEEEHRKSDNEEFEAFERVIPLFWIFFQYIGISYYCLTRFVGNFFDGLIDQNWPKMLILGIFSSQFQDINCYKVWSVSLEKISNKFMVVLLFGNIDENIFEFIETGRQ